MGGNDLSTSITDTKTKTKKKKIKKTTTTTTEEVRFIQSFEIERERLQ